MTLMSLMNILFCHQHASFGIVLLGYVWDVTTLCVPKPTMRAYFAA